MSYYLDGKLDIGGIETDRRAKKYQADNPGTNYQNAVAAVIKESNRALQQNINRAAARYQQEGSLSHNGVQFRTFETRTIGEKWRAPLSEMVGRIAEFCKGITGEPCRIRTGDPLLKRQMLYRLS